MFKAIIFLPLIGAIIAGLFGRYIGARASEIVTSSFLVVAAILSCIGFYEVTVLGQSQTLHLLSWISSGSLEINWMLRIDSLTAVMLVVVTGVSALVHIYSIGYMHDDPYRPRFFAYLSLFTFMMLALVTADNFVQLFFGWEGVGLASYLLIGFYFQKSSANAAAIKAFVVNRVGDFGLILGMAAIYLTTDTLSFDGVFEAREALAAGKFEFLGFTLPVLDTICLLLFMGAMGKSAQFLLHTWLPDAMEGPTPVSALIHAATMVTAGVFLVARCSPLFELSPTALTVITVVGAITAFFAATIGLVQNDIKRVIAYSTCSQLGYMFVALGLGAYQVAMFHLFTHAFFKALLFLGAGSVIHAMHHEQDMRNMGGLRQLIPLTWILMIIGTIALTGFPLTAGYFSKDAIIEAAFAGVIGPHMFAFTLLVVAAGFTSFYSWRLIFLTFHGVPRCSNDTLSHVHEAPAVMSVPLILLSLGALFAGAIFASSFIGDGQGAFWQGAIFTLPDNQILQELHHVPALVKYAPLIMMLLGLVSAWYFYIRRPDLPPKIAESQVLLYQFLLNKWYFDEIYDFLFVRPVRWLGRIFWKGGDGAIIDGLGPDGVSRVVIQATGRFVKVQTGFLYHYAFVMLLGIAGFVSWFLMSGGH